MRKGYVSPTQLRGSCTGLWTKRTYIVEIDVDPAIVREHKVPNGICPLYSVGIIIKGV